MSEEDDHDKCWEAYRVWVEETPKTVRETPGSDHEREIAWLNFRKGWLAALASRGISGDKS